VIVDEAHHVVANSYGKILAGYPEATVLGFTATPNRADGTGLREVFDELFVIAQPAELIALGELAEPHVYGAPKNAGDLRKLRMRGLKLQGGDYARKQLGETMNHRTLVGHIINEWKRLAGGKPTVVFASNVEHSKEICRRFNAAGINAEHIDMGTSEDEREAILKKLDTGEIKVVCNYDVLTEGWDQPRVRCLVLARPTRSETVCIQQAGRVMRVFGNQRAIILDHAGNFFRFKLPQERREHSLDAVSLAGGGGFPNKQCPECERMIFAFAQTCEHCGHVFPKELSTEEIEAELARVERDSAMKIVKALRAAAYGT
jgi:DNA repair protein RadD